MIDEFDERHVTAGPIDRWKPGEMVRYDWGKRSFILTYGFIYAFETDRPDIPEVRERTEQLLFYKVKERLIREGLATLLNDEQAATLPCSPVLATVVPSKYVKKPVLLMPFPEGYEMVKTVMKAGNMVSTEKVDWKELVD